MSRPLFPAASCQPELIRLEMAGVRLKIQGLGFRVFKAENSVSLGLLDPA